MRDIHNISNKFLMAWMLLAICLSGYLSINGALGYYYSIDELYNIRIAEGKTLKEVLQFSLYETHPPLGHIIRHYWIKISEDIVFVKSLSLLFGLLSLPVFFKIGEKINGRLAGVLTTAIIAFNISFNAQAFLARNYTIFLFFLAVSFYYYLLWRENFKRAHLITYALFAILASFTHFSGIFFAFSIAAFESVKLFLTKEKTHYLKFWIPINGIIGFLGILLYKIWDMNAIVMPYYIGNYNMGSYNFYIIAILYPLHIIFDVVPSQVLFLEILIVFTG